MSHLDLRLPGFRNSDTHKQDAQKNSPEQLASAAQGAGVRLRIIQDGKIYRSKAEQERLVELGKWHHRRQRRRNRLRGYSN